MQACNFKEDGRAESHKQITKDLREMREQAMRTSSEFLSLR